MDLRKYARVPRRAATVGTPASQQQLNDQSMLGHMFGDEFRAPKKLPRLTPKVKKDKHGDIKRIRTDLPPPTPRLETPEPRASYAPRQVRRG
jgi:hypothetical protein